MYDYLIVGAGVAGCILAERLAEHGHKVLLVEKRNHIGGNTYDEYNQEGILIHRFGPHIFRTNSRVIWDYLSRFTEWYPYQHRVLAYVDSLLVPIPVNLDTVNLLYNYQFSSDELQVYMAKTRPKLGVGDRIKDARAMTISQVGEDLYNKLFKNYTRKQWDLSPEELDPEVTGRIPVRLNRDARYFTDKYQGLPRYGYTKMFSRMLDHPKIQVLLQTDFKTVVDDLKFKRMIYTGPIDYFFDYAHGRLPYRSLRFEYETLATEYYQVVGTINYPNDYDFTRITEYKHLTGQKHHLTTIAREYPQAEGEPFYPIPTKENRDLYNLYLLEQKKLKNVYFVGRLAEYRYFSMDQVITHVFNWLRDNLS